MALKFIILFAGIFSVNATLPSFKDANDIPPEQVGLYHTEAFDRLAEMYTTEKPKNFHYVVKDMIGIVSSYCEDRACRRSVRKSAFEKVEFGKTHMRDAYPEDLDLTVKEHLESIESTIRSLDTQNEQEVIGGLTLLQDTLRETADIKESNKYVGLAAGSIAIESTKLWSSVLSNPDHPLNAAKEASSISGNLFHRNLQDIEVQVELEQTPQNQLIILFDVLGLVLFLGFPIPAIFASLYAFYFLQIEVVVPQAPTSKPSSLPSSLPSSKPSNSPSSKPSNSPSSKPSVTPSRKPL